MKKRRTFLTVLLLCLGLCACGNDVQQSTPGNTEPPHEHIFSGWETVLEPGCETAGREERKCLCGAKEEQASVALGHRFSEATCTDPKTCTVCGNTEGTPLGHSEVIDEGIEPLPTEDGLTEGKHCGVCGQVLIPQKVIPATGSVGLSYRVNPDGVSCTISGMGSCSDSKIVIPEVYEGYTVTALGDRAFYQQTGITSVRLPDTVTEVGRAVFGRCNHLESINIPKGLTYIGIEMFWDCDKLTAFEIPGHITTIKELAFFGCDRLTDLRIPESVTTIESGAFCGCWRLPSITLPNSITRIESGLFSDCHNLESIVIPESITSIAPDAFNECFKLGEAYGECRYLAFRGNPYYFLVGTVGKDMTAVDIQPGTVIIGKEAFWDCYSLEKVTIPDSVREIGDCAFNYCQSLTEVTIPEGVTRLQIWTFSGCASLKSVRIPGSITYIGELVFSRCQELTDIHYAGTMAQWLAIEKEEGTNGWDMAAGDYTVHCTDGDISR